MGSKNCMNEVCRATTSSEWKKGWSLKSGGFATLCSDCGTAYENFVFCKTFHLDESGWRECRLCQKHIHCGCVASKNLYEYMDFGGVACKSCSKRLEIHSAQSMQIPDDISNGTFVTNGIRDVPTAVENRIGDDKFSTERLLQLTKAISVNNVASALEQLKRENSTLKTGESSKHIPNLSQQCSSSAFAKTDNSRQKHGVKDMHESLTHPSLNFSLTTPLCSSNTVPPFLGGVVEGSEHNKGSFQHAQKTRNNFPKLSKPSPTAETNKGHVLQTRVARPPAEGRGRNQLLPRYWPRITDQELQQLSGDLKSTIVPLFEKILSASDAGRIGRLVLPKACAEAYFPTINQSEGIQIKIQDIKGKEWTFQFRFWPNNNSRMYVLEGVTPCIQSMQLQAGDTVIFSRIDPGGQLVIGCRKANNVDVQDTPTTTAPNGDSPREALFSGVTDKLSNAGRAPDDSMQQHMTISQKKKTRNIKNQRPLMHNEDAVELRITWEEAQELFRPSQSVEPTVVVVEGQEFEEFEEPPIFGKRTIFISQSLGHSCSAPEEIHPRDLDFFSMNNGSKKRRVSESKPSREGEPSGLDALANAAVLGDNVRDLVESSVGATTRHPRHRPGCTCIVCIQPPSGKGKHDPACKCNVCSTVRRRFKTLMMRKKKRQSEREAELAQEKDNNSSVAKIELEREGIAGHALLNMSHPESGTNHNGSHAGLDDMNKGQLDLNCDPHREDDILAEAAGVSLTDLVNAATLPLDVYPGQNGTPNLEPCLFSRTSAAAASEENATDEGGLTAGHVDRKDG